MTFRIMALIMTCAGCLLGLRFIFAAGAVLKEWNIEATAGSLVVSRRLGAIYLGLFEFRAQRVSAGVFRSVVAEAVLAVGFVWAWWGGR